MKNRPVKGNTQISAYSMIIPKCCRFSAECARRPPDSMPPGTSCSNNVLKVPGLTRRIKRSIKGAQHWEMTSSRRRNPGRNRLKTLSRPPLNLAPPARPIRLGGPMRRIGAISPRGAPTTGRSSFRRRRRPWPPISARSPARAPRCRPSAAAAPRSGDVHRRAGHDNPVAHAGVKATLAPASIRAHQIDRSWSRPASGWLTSWAIEADSSPAVATRFICASLLMAA